MADEVIGSLGVQIEADASDLPGQYDAAVRASEDAAERIAGAFESVVGIGEALAITEGLREFTVEALTAYGTVQSVTIGLTELTKSASDANEIIGQIKELAATEPFAFPEIAPTVQKMVALGVSAEQIPGVMQAAADAAAATGNSFQAVANSIDRMSLSGTVSARSLVQLGVSTEDLGRVMGVTTEEVKKAFAALDQEERINVLTEALAKFSGAAEAQAKGIAGEWQIFKNQFEEVMVAVGEALAPTAELIMQFGRDVISVVQPVIEAFNKLPDPIKQVVEVAGLAFIAIGPLAKALEAVGIASGEAAIGQAAQTIATAAQGEAAAAAAISENALTLSLGQAGTASGTYFLATTEATTATVAAGEGAAAAGIGITAMGAAATLAGAALATFVGYEIGTWAQNNIPGLVALERHLIDFASTYLPNFGAALDHVKQQFNLNGEAAVSEAEEIKTLQAALRESGVVLEQNGDENEHFIAVLRDVRQAIADTAKEAGESGLGGGLDALVEKQEKLNAAEQQAAADLLIAKQAYADGTISLDVLTAAQDAYTKAVTAAQSKSAEFKDSVAGITEAYNKQQSQIATLQQTVMALMAAQDGSAAMAEKLITAQSKLEAAYKSIDTAAKAFTVTIQGTGEQFSYMGDQAEALVQKQRDLTLSVQQAQAVLDRLNESTDTSTAHTKAVADAVNQYVTALKNSGAAMSDTISINVNGVQVMTTVADAVNQVRNAHQQLQATMENGVSVIRLHEQAQSTLSDVLAKQPGLLTNLSSQYFNADTAVRAMISSEASLNVQLTNAQGIVDDLRQRLAAGNLTTQQAADVTRALEDALKNLISIQQQVPGAAGAASSAIADETNQLNQLTNAANAAGQALDNADVSMKQFAAGTEGKLGSTNAMGLGIWAMAAQLTGLTAFAGSGVDFSKGQMSAIDELSVLQQQQAVAQEKLNAATTHAITLTTQHAAATTTLANATSGNATALGTKTTATTTATAATSSLATATTSLVTAAAAAVNALNSSSITTTDALGNVTTAYTTTTNAAQQFVDGLGNVYNSYNAVVNAIKMNPLLAGPAQSTSVNTQVMGGASSFTPGPIKPEGGTTAGVNALPNVLATLPNGTVVTGSPGQTLQDALRLLFPGGPSGGMSVSGPSQPAIVPSGSGFGSSPALAGGGVNLVMNYPSFNSQGQAQQIMNQMVTMLRTVPGLKI